MGLWTSLRWAASEGVGAGANRRLVRLLCRTFQRDAKILGPGTSGLWVQFLASANMVVNRLGPAWARWKVGGR